MLHPRTPYKTAAAAALGTGVLLAGGVAAAATGSLPGAAQGTARHMLERVGVTVPGADEHSDGHAEARGASSDHVPASSGGAEDAPGSEAGSAGKGDDVSQLATSDETSGIEKGAEVSDFASRGASHAGEDHPGDAPEGSVSGGDSAGHARVETPTTAGPIARTTSAVTRARSTLTRLRATAAAPVQPMTSATVGARVDRRPPPALAMVTAPRDRRTPLGSGSDTQAPAPQGCEHVGGCGAAASVTRGRGY